MSLERTLVIVKPDGMQKNLTGIILSYMQQCPVMLWVLEGENAIAKVRELLGPTDSRLAPRGTIRGDFGVDKSTNVVHASDSADSAKKEIARFFKKEEIFG